MLLENYEEIETWIGLASPAIDKCKSLHTYILFTCCKKVIKYFFGCYDIEESVLDFLWMSFWGS